MRDISVEEIFGKAWLYFFLIIAVLIGLYIYTRSDWILYLLVPMVAIALRGVWAGRLVVWGFSGLKRHATKTALSEWQGNYYQWDNHHIRVVETEREVWIVGDDLLEASGMKPDANLRRKLKLSYGGYCQIPETRFEGFNQTAALQFLQNKQENNSDIIKLKLWLEREVYATLRRKKDNKTLNAG